MDMCLIGSLYMCGFLYVQLQWPGKLPLPNWGGVLTRAGVAESRLGTATQRLR